MASSQVQPESAAEAGLRGEVSSECKRQGSGDCGELEKKSSWLQAIAVWRSQFNPRMPTVPG
jgi:hypothetical protein